jgi:hypothetical protein
LAEKLIELDLRQEKLEAMGKQAEKLAAQLFDKDYLAQKMLNGILEATR